MLGRYSVYDFPYPHYHSLRLKAVELLESCLMEQDSQLFETFIENQLLSDPPPLDLLSDLAEDIDNRLRALRANPSHDPLTDGHGDTYLRKLFLLEHLARFIADWRLALQAQRARRALAQIGFNSRHDDDNIVIH